MKLSGLIKQAIYYALFITTLLFSFRLMSYGMLESDWHDFNVFYNAAKTALAGNSIYTVSGPYKLPFWYFPWAAWFFIPFAMFPVSIALSLYKVVTVLSAILVLNKLGCHFKLELKLQDKIFILLLFIPITLQIMIVGQMDYILLALTLAVMFAIEQRKDILAGFLFPLLWIKPHLFIVFTLFAFWRAGKRTMITSALLSTTVLLLETILTPNWLSDMLNLLKAGSQRTESVGFTTLPNLLGSQENWVGTANLPFTVLLIVLAVLIVWNFRTLPTVHLLTLALTASLFCAPRAHAYDLTFLIPALLWLTSTSFMSRTLWLWIAAAIIPLLTRYSTGAYILTLFIFILNIWKANQYLQLSTTSPKTIK